MWAVALSMTQLLNDHLQGGAHITHNRGHVIFTPHFCSVKPAHARWNGIPFVTLMLREHAVWEALHLDNSFIQPVTAGNISQWQTKSKVAGEIREGCICLQLCVINCSECLKRQFVRLGQDFNLKWWRQRKAEALASASQTSAQGNRPCSWTRSGATQEEVNPEWLLAWLFTAGDGSWWAKACCVTLNLDDLLM